MGRIILSSVICLFVPHFSTVSLKRHDTRRGLMKKKYLFGISLQLISETFSFWEELSEILSQMHKGLDINYPLCL